MANLAEILKIISKLIDLEEALAKEIKKVKNVKRRKKLKKACRKRNLDTIRDMLFK